MDIVRSQTFPDKKLRLGWEFLQVSEWSDHQNKINQRPVCHQGCSWAAVHSREVKKWKHWTGTLRTKRGNIPTSTWSVCFYACPSYSSSWWVIVDLFTIFTFTKYKIAERCIVNGLTLCKRWNKGKHSNKHFWFYLLTSCVAVGTSFQTEQSNPVQQNMVFHHCYKVAVRKLHRFKQDSGIRMQCPSSFDIATFQHWTLHYTSV